MRNAYLLSLSLLMAACAPTQFRYKEPAEAAPPVQSVAIAASFDQAWSRVILNAGKSFFVINNLDKSSGFLNLSYSGDPTELLDCGEYIVESQNAEGRADGTYPLARESQTIHMRTGINVDTLMQHDVHVEGRANIVLREIKPSQTEMQVTVRYVVRRNARFLSGFSPLPPGISESASFNTGQVGLFPTRVGGKQLACVSTGAFEQRLSALGL